MFENILMTAAALAMVTPEPCVTRDQAGSIGLAVLPYMVDNISEACRPHLNDDAFVYTGGDAFRERVSNAAAERHGDIISAFGVFASGSGPDASSGNADEFISMMASGAASWLSASIDPEDCADVDALLGAMAPLPTENVALMFSSIFSLAGVGEEPGGSPPICRP